MRQVGIRRAGHRDHRRCFHRCQRRNRNRLGRIEILGGRRVVVEPRFAGRENEIAADVGTGIENDLAGSGRDVVAQIAGRAVVVGHVDVVKREGDIARVGDFVGERDGVAGSDFGRVRRVVGIDAVGEFFDIDARIERIDRRRSRPWRCRRN